jgi:hypothetical protein
MLLFCRARRAMINRPNGIGAAPQLQRQRPLPQ